MKRYIIFLFLFAAFAVGLGLTFVLPTLLKLKNEQNKFSVVARSKAPGFIADVYIAKGLDEATGRAKSLANSFVPTDDDIFLVVKLHNLSTKARLEYVRYRNDKYLDHGSIQIAKTNAQYASINWSSHPPLGNRPKGTYLIKVYTNGRLEKTTTYTVS